MQRCRDQLHARRSEELRYRRTRKEFFRRFREGDRGRDQRWEVEGCENREAVAGCEEGVGYGWDGSHGSSGTEKARELAVFVEAEREICGACRDEFCWAWSHGRGGLVLQGGGYGVDCVGGQVGSGVEREDEEEGLR